MYDELKEQINKVCLFVCLIADYLIHFHCCINVLLIQHVQLLAQTFLLACQEAHEPTMDATEMLLVNLLSILYKAILNLEPVITAVT